MCSFKNTAALLPTLITNMMPETVTANPAAVLISFTMDTGRPTYEDIQLMHDTLTAVLITILYYENNGAHNLWGLIVPTTVYQAKYTVLFPHPTKPAFYPNTTTITNDVTNVVRVQAEAPQAAEKANYALYNTAKHGGQRFALNIIDKTWYHELKNKPSSYALLTARVSFDHITMQCGDLTKSKASELSHQPPGLWDLAGNVVVNINMMQGLHKEAKLAEAPINDTLLAASADCEVDDWTSLPMTEQTWTKWKEGFCPTHENAKTA